MHRPQNRRCSPQKGVRVWCGARDCWTAIRTSYHTQTENVQNFGLRVVGESFQDGKSQLLIHHNILRLCICRIPSSDHILVCGQYSVLCSYHLHQLPFDISVLYMYYVGAHSVTCHRYEITESNLK